MNSKLKAMLGILTVVFLFVFISYYTQKNLDFIKDLIGNDYKGILAYILITCLAVVIAPMSTLPLVPIASNIWGGFYSSIFNITGWFLGALISFGIARRYGVPLVKKFVSLEKINKIESKIPKENLFFGVVVLRMMIPVDILSYALGLFSKIDFKKYSIATLIGITPFAIFLSYLGAVPFYYQVFGWIMILILVYLITRFYKKTFSDSLKKNL